MLLSTMRGCLSKHCYGTLDYRIPYRIPTCRYISCESLAVTLSETLETVLDVPVDEMNKCEDLLAADREMRAMQIVS